MKNRSVTHALRTTSLPIFKLSDGSTIVERMQTISSAIAQRAYELFESRQFEHGHDQEDWFRAESEVLTPVPVKVVETEGELRVRAELRGFTDQHLQVGIAPWRLLICGQKRQTSQQANVIKMHRGKSAEGIFRVLDLPNEIDPDKVTAILENEILDITLPRRSPAKKVPVGVEAA